jgi:WG containing repeat
MFDDSSDKQPTEDQLDTNGNLFTAGPWVREPKGIRVEEFDGIERITRPYREGLAAQKVGPKWGFIDEHGHLAIKRRFNACFDFSEGLAAVTIGEKWTFVNRLGARIHEPSFDEVTSFVSGFAECG